MTETSHHVHTERAPSVDPGHDRTAPVDVSPEAIAALVAAGADALRVVPGREDRAEGQADALALLVGVTHDLRSPLSSMLMLIERLRAGHAGPVTPLQEQQLGLLYAAAFGVAALTSDALDVARGAAWDLRHDPPAPFSVSEVWHAVRGLVQPIAEEKRLVLRWSGLSHDVRMGHARVVHRVLLNLVTNALKFTTVGTVTVSVEESGGESVRFSVTDTGEGLPAAIRLQLRRRHAQSPRPAVASSGLGIAMCQQMLEAVGSRLEDWSGDSVRGTSLGFVVPLPRA